MARYKATSKGNVPYTAQEEAEADAQYAAWVASEPDRKAVSIRAKRDSLLAETDWIVIMHTEKGTNIPAAWEIYRQNLRDITAQAGFPHTVTWPEKPE